MDKSQAIVAKVALCLVLVLALGFFPTWGLAAPVVLGSDDPNGLVAPINFPTAPTFFGPILVASDSEVFFDPFNFGADTSDGIQFPADSPWQPLDVPAFGPGFWTKINANTWVLPAGTPCGGENEPACEPVATWFALGLVWPQGTPSELVMLEANGSISDTISLNNLGPGGSAQISFASDSVPAPGALLLVGTGLLGIGITGFLRRKLLP